MTSIKPFTSPRPSHDGFISCYAFPEKNIVLYKNGMFQRLSVR